MNWPPFGCNFSFARPVFSGMVTQCLLIDLSLNLFGSCSSGRALSYLASRVTEGHLKRPNGFSSQKPFHRKSELVVIDH